MKEKIISQEVVVTNSVTDTAVASIMQEVATLIYNDIVQ
jgi:hypothetical protein